jgi:DNA-binding FadR family transcriptional regulator
MSIDITRRAPKQTSTDRLLSSLQEAIDSGRWKPGERIPTERALSDRYGMARNTIRRALRQLEDAGRIVRHVGRGTFVEQGKPIPSDDLARRIENASPNEIMEVRLMIEPQAAECAAARANGAELDAMAECLRKGEAAPTVAEFEMWDGLFHQTIVAACRNHLLIDIYDAINAVRRKADWAALKERVVTPGRRGVTQKQHRGILAALRARDAQRAGLEMKNHLVDVRRSLVGS